MGNELGVEFANALKDVHEIERILAEDRRAGIDLNRHWEKP
jgi:hypothetical protein